MKKIKRARLKCYVKGNAAEICCWSAVPQGCLHTLSCESESAELKARMA